MIGHLNRLAAFRKASGITQLELANILGVSQSNIARLEKNPETISLEQLEDWLRACKLMQMPHADFIQKLVEIPEPNIVQFARGIEEALGSVGMVVDLRQKPLLTVCSDGVASAKYQTTFVRDLMTLGDKLFFGYYLPPDNGTVLWKHISDRPSKLNESVYVLDGILEPWMRHMPTKYLSVAVDSEGKERSGSFAKISNDEDMCGQVIIVFSNHPLLRHFDVIQVAPFSYDIQSFHNFRMIVHAEISVLCVSCALRLTAPAWFTGLVTGRGFDFLVCREGVNTDAVQRSLASLYGRMPKVFTLHHLSPLGRGSNDAFAELGKLVFQRAVRVQAELLRIVNNGAYEPDEIGLGIIRNLPSKIGELGIREQVFFRLAGGSELSFPLTLQQLSNIFSLVSMTMNPRLDSHIEIDESEYKTMLEKALSNLDQNLLIDIVKRNGEMRLRILESTRKMIATIWQQATLNTLT